MTDSQEKKPPEAINYYADKYWNDLPAVRAYIYQNATGDKNLSWILYLKKRYAEKPFTNCLILACGNGWAERELYDNGVALEFDAFDYLDSSIELARQQKGDRPINYFKSSFNELVLEKQYDLIVNVGALHHAASLDELLNKLALAMSPEGIFVNWDYVGPNRNQYTDENMKLMTELNESLPPRFQTKHPLRLGVDSFIKGDITEAVCSSDIISTFEKYFEVIERRNLGGGIAYQLLWNNISEFLKEDPEAKAQLEKILNMDALHTKNRTVSNLFAFFIGEPRHYATTLQESTGKFYLSRLESQLELQLKENANLSERIRELEQKQATNAQQNLSMIGHESFLKKIAKIFR